MKTTAWGMLISLILGFGMASESQAQPPRPRNGGEEITLDEAVSQVRGGNRQVMSARTMDQNGRLVHIIRALTPDGRVQRFQLDAERYTGPLSGPERRGRRPR